MIEKVNIDDKFKEIVNHWHPKIIGDLNGQYVKLAKFQGEFIWHSHETEDELFFVLKGQLLMKLREKDILLKEGEMIIIPAKTEHLPVALEEVYVLLFEPISTINTGSIVNERTKHQHEQI